MEVKQTNMNIQGDGDLFYFLTNAPKEFREGERIRKYQLKNGDFIHCVLWNNHFYITGTDVVKILVWRFQNSGRNLVSLKKFEEGIFSDLRNLKPGVDATLESPRSEFLEFLYKNGCIRTQKKQKVFFWYSVPHDSLFCDALERDLRRENTLVSYNKYMNEEQPQYYPDDFSVSMQRKSYKRQSNPPPIVMPPTYDPIPQYNSSRLQGSENNMIKNLLFNNPVPSNFQYSYGEKNSQEFVPPFAFDDFDFKNSLEDQSDLFNISRDYELKKYSELKTEKDERMGNNNETYPMPNSKGGFQK